MERGGLDHREQKRPPGVRDGPGRLDGARLDAPPGRDVVAFVLFEAKVAAARLRRLMRSAADQMTAN